MAPEQKGTPPLADNRADVYSLGVVFYEMLTGELPAREIEPPSRKVEVDVRIDEIVLRALERHPEMRFQTVSAFRTEVDTASAALPKSPAMPARSPKRSSLTWPKLVLILFIALAGALVCVPLAHLAIVGLLYAYNGSKGRPVPLTSEAGLPPQIEFKFSRVELPPGGHSLRLYFERDARPGLGLEVSQELRHAPHGGGPQKDYRGAEVKTWVGVRDPQVLQWVLPMDFGVEEVRTVAKALEARARQYRELPSGGVIEFAAAQHRDGWSYHLLARVKPEPSAEPEPGQPHPAPPAGAVFTYEHRVIVPQEGRVTVALYRSANDSERIPMNSRITFKTASDSDLGVLLRWQAYGPEHPTHANRWMLDLIDPKTGVIFHRMEDGFAEPVRMRPLEGAPPGKDKPFALVNRGNSAFLRMCMPSRIPPAGEPIRAWWDIQAIVSFDQQGDQTLFQLPAAPLPAAAFGRREGNEAPGHSAVLNPLARSPDWLAGKWVFDLDSTNQKLAEDQKGKDSAGLGDLANAMVIPRLIDALDGSTIVIKGQDFTMTTKDGNGKSYTYEVQEVPDGDSVVVKMSDGEINTLHREGQWLWMTSTGTVHLRAFFKRVP